MKLTNREMDEYLYSLKQLATKTKGKLAFAMAKNMRMLSNELIEYNSVKDNLIRQYGEENSDGTFQIKMNSDGFNVFIKELQKYNDIESDVNITMVDPADIYESTLDGQEIMQLLFMINEEEKTNDIE